LPIFLMVPGGKRTLALSRKVLWFALGALSQLFAEISWPPAWKR
jgi:hypothetical protein